MFCIQNFRFYLIDKPVFTDIIMHRILMFKGEDMAIVETKNLSVGMVAADNIYSKAGQLIVRKDSILTRQMIAHLKYYFIHEIEILDGALPDEIQKALDNQKNLETTHLERLLASEEYKQFRKEYDTSVTFLQECVNDIVKKNAPVDTPKLIAETIRLFDKEPSYYSLFAMLHSMKHIDDSTYAHSVNVAMIARLIGSWCGFNGEDLDQLTLAGLLHDIGKCQIPSEILLTPRKLTKQEYEFVKMHTQFGYDVIKNQDLDRRVKQTVLLHHERCDGTGYPFGHTLDNLEDFECIVSIADVYDAMTADRCYRSGLCPFEVISTFEAEGLQKYHPKYIMVFLEKIASSYLNSEVLLSNQEIARIVYINNRLTRPIVQLKNNEFLNLLDHPDVYIQTII